MISKKTFKAITKELPANVLDMILDHLYFTLGEKEMSHVINLIMDPDMPLIKADPMELRKGTTCTKFDHVESVDQIENKIVFLGEDAAGVMHRYTKYFDL